MAAEEAVRARSEQEEVSQEEIFTALARALSWNKMEADRALQIENACELDSIQPVSHIIRRIKDAPALGRPPIFISDSYFPSPFVTALLERCGVPHAPERLFVSSDFRLRKESGNLFPAVAKRLGLQPSQILHCGDNSFADWHRAVQAGFKSDLFEGAKPNRYERIYEEQPGFDRLYRSALAGSARAARLSAGELDGHRKAIWETGADVSGPLLFSYVLWVLLSAREEGISRLYFTARDGQILMKLGGMISAQLNLGIDCRYLFASRQSWHLPSLTAMDSHSQQWILDKAEGSTIRRVLARLELSVDEVAGPLERYGLGSVDCDEPLGPTRLQAFHRLLTDREFQTIACGQAAAYRTCLLQYLEQEGLLDGSSFALVDLGWYGRLQTSLSRVLETAPAWSGRKLTGYYLDFLIEPDSTEQVAFRRYTSASPWAGKGLDLPHNGPLLEIFCAADHGSVRSFEGDAVGCMKPRLVEERNLSALEWGLAAQQEAILAFASLLLGSIQQASLQPMLLSKLMRVSTEASFRLFLERPGREEAAAFGCFAHAEDQTHGSTFEFAPPLDLQGFLQAIRDPAQQVKWRQWPYGSIRRSFASDIMAEAVRRAFVLQRTLRRSWARSFARLMGWLGLKRARSA